MSMNAKSYSNEALKRDLDNLAKEHEKRFNQIIETYGMPTGRDSEETNELNRWFVMEVKKIRAKYGM